MEVISKATLLDLFKRFYDDEFMRVDELETLLMSACKELDPWLPIKDAPKDRNLLLINASNLSCYIGYFDSLIGVWCIQGTVDFIPIHYKELPPYPKD